MILSSGKFNAIAEILRDIGQIFFASLFVAPIFSKSEQDLVVILLGFVVSYICWLFSFALSK